MNTAGKGAGKGGPEKAAGKAGKGDRVHYLDKMASGAFNMIPCHAVRAMHGAATATMSSMCDTMSCFDLMQSVRIPMSTPVFCHGYPTGTCDGSNSIVRSSRDNVSLP